MQEGIEKRLRDKLLYIFDGKEPKRKTLFQFNLFCSHVEQFLLEEVRKCNRPPDCEWTYTPQNEHYWPACNRTGFNWSEIGKMHSIYRFCPFCGGKITTKNEGRGDE